MKDYNISIKTMLGILLMIVSVFGRTEVVTVTYVHTDHLGSPTLLVDESGSVVHQMQYSPFGAHQGSPDIATGYTGHLEDEASDLTYMGARWYDHEVGRFVSPDPVRFSQDVLLSFNRYQYALNNSYKYYDPDGEWSIEIGLYKKVGAGLTISYYEGLLEVTGDMGVGMGAGVAFDWSGRPSLHAKRGGSGVIGRTRTEGALIFQLGPVHAGLEAGVRTGNMHEQRSGGGYIYGSANEGIVSFNKDSPIRARAKAGGRYSSEVGLYYDFRK